MFSLRKALVLATLFLGAFSSPAPAQQEDSPVDWDTFQRLLDTVDPTALHNVLHALSPKFQDGVFSKDRSAMEHVHSENPVVASKLVYLAKRQASNSTITAHSTAAASPTPSTPKESSAAAVQSSQAVQSASRAASISSALASEITASTLPPLTTIFVAPSAPPSATPIKTTNGAVVFSTQGGGLVTLTSSAVGVSFTRSTSTHLVYTTLPDGQVQTSTELIIVNAPVTASNTATAAAAATTSSPGLQNGASKGEIGGALGALGVVFAGAVILL